MPDFLYIILYMSLVIAGSAVLPLTLFFSLTSKRLHGYK